jgi:hypothetical protein
MFGMLDYRAYKLYWLICLPFRVAVRLLFFVILGIAIFIGVWSGYHVLIQMVVAYVTFEVILLVFVLLWALLIAKPLEKIFFWVIGVVPSRGENAEEANLVARAGPIVWLSNKFANDIENWTIEDTEEFAKCLNWRARLLFNAKQRVWNRASVLRQAFWDTGKQPVELGGAETEKLLRPYQDSKLETVITHPQGWNAVIGVIVIVAAILFFAPR